MNRIDILIGKELKIARLEKGLTLQQIADYIGVTRQTVSHWEKGDRSLNIDDYVKICDHFGFDAQKMLDNVMQLVRE